MSLKKTVNNLLARSILILPSRSVIPLRILSGSIDDFHQSDRV